MKEMDLTQLLGKAEELRALFVLGQRVIPFIEEIFIFVSEIKPLLDEINISIKDNLKKMPKASKQLSKVTQATEMATIEIMDIVDALFYKTDVISSNIAKLTEINANSLNNPSNLISLISNAIDKENESIASELQNNISEYKENSESEFNNTVNKTNDIISSIKDDSNSIMMALQMQDITSQQIAAVNNLLETVQGKLSQIIEKFHQSDIGEFVATGNLNATINNNTTTDQNTNPNINVSKMHREIAFDPDAVDSIAQKEFRQSNVDDLIKNFDPNADYKADEYMQTVDSNDIDSMFNANISSGTVAEVNVNSDEEISSDDIDILFNAATTSDNIQASQTENNSTENKEVASISDSGDDNFDFSQDDIDALFGN